MYHDNFIAGLDGADIHVKVIGWLISYSNLLPSILIFSVGKTVKEKMRVNNFFFYFYF